MENKILEQIKKSETAMLDTLAQIVNIDSGYDALAGIDEVAHIIGDFLTPYGFEVQYIETPNAPTHVLAKRPRPGKKKVMLRVIWIRFSLRERRLPDHSGSKTAKLMVPVLWI